MKLIATVGGVGYVPFLPGTAGSLVGLALAGLLRADPAHQAISAAVAAGLGLWSAGPAARAMGKADPGPIVIDEVAGMMVALAALPATWELYLIGFLLFRFLDVLKPPPLRQLERLPGSWGIMLDDLAAGVATRLLLALFLRMGTGHLF